MALDKLVDSAQLDSDLGDVADAIRAKSGGSSQLAFPAGFVSEIGSIQTGGEDTLAELIENTLVDYSYDGTSRIRESLFTQSKSIRDVRFPNTPQIERSCFAYSSVRNVFAPKALINDASFRGCNNLLIAVTRAVYAGANVFAKYSGTMKLTTVDLTSKGNAGLTASMFTGCENLVTLILRQSVIYPLGNINAFTQTPFASGGTGGTIYIPKALYDHLGDGTSLDYKAATNWSTIDGYGTITWAQIEGSQYENYYADGTPIPSE